MLRAWIIPAGAGVLSALLFLSIAVGSVGAIIFCYLAPLPLFAMGLGAGLISAATAGATATALVGLVAGLIPAVSFGVIFVAPVVMLVRYALLSRIDAQGRLEWYPVGRLLMWLVGAGATLFVVASFLLPGGRPVEERLRSTIGPPLSAYFRGMPPEHLHVAIEQFSRVPALVVLFLLLIIAANAILAQGLLAGARHNLRPSPKVAEIELPRAIGYATALAVTANLLGSGWLEFTGRNVLVILGFAFFFAGLGVVHWFVRGPHRLLVLSVFYFSMVPFMPFVPPFVAALGFIDHWLHFRQRFGGSAPGSV